MSRENHHVAVLVLEGAKPLDVGIPAQVFSSRPSMPYEVRVCGPAPGLVTGGDGLSYHVAEGLDALEHADTIFIPGYREPATTEPPAAVVGALMAAHERGARLAAISTGAFALAATGLLDGKRATTHWHYTRALAERHPLVRVDENVLFVDEGDVLTSAGAASGIDLCLHLVRRDHGVGQSNHVARRLVAAPYRSGGQAQYVPRTVPEPLGDLFASTREWALAHLAVPVPVGSIVELNTTVSRGVTRDEVLAAYRAAADGRLKGILEYADEPLVSSDITGRPASAIFDAALTRVAGDHVKVVAWYDNEWGFSNRVIDTLELLARG
jgi:transcriptional regulator GlxA family with amidase domain